MGDNIPLFIMNTTIRYWFENESFARHLSFKTYQKALDCIENFKQLNIRAEVKLY